MVVEAVGSRVGGFIRGASGVPESPASQLATVEQRLSLASPAALYEFLRALYYNDDKPYNDVTALDDYKDTQGYRNPVHGAVEFYVATLFPGPLDHAFPLNIPRGARADNIKKAIETIWTNSNWGTRKQVHVRLTAMLGDGFIQSAIRQNSDGEPVAAYMAVVDPKFVTNFDTDERGYLNYIRVDTPRARRTSAGYENYLRTEEWSKFSGWYRRWESNLNTPDTPIEDLLGFDEDASDLLEAFGIDFVPFTHAKFLDDLYPRGLAAAMPGIRKAAEASRMTTELHRKLFRYNQPDLQLVGALRDADGHIFTPGTITWDQPTTRDVAGYRRMATPPAGHEIKPIASNIDYKAHQEAIAELMTNMQEGDFPELAWYQRNENNQSGRALRIKLVPATAKAEEARGNLEAALIRSHQMCMTLAQANEINGFSNAEIGTYESGDFEHTFEERDILPLSEDERAEILDKQSQAAERMIRIGFSFEYVAREVFGMTAEQIAENATALTSAQVAGEVIDGAVTGSAAFNRE